MQISNWTALLLFFITILPGVVLISYQERIVVAEKVSIFLETARIAKVSTYFSIVSVIILLVVSALCNEFWTILDLLFGESLPAERKVEVLLFCIGFLFLNCTLPHLYGWWLLKSNSKNTFINKTAWSLTFEKFQEAVEKIEEEYIKGEIKVAVVVSSGMVYEGTLEQYSVKPPYEDREITLSEVRIYKSLEKSEWVIAENLETVIVPGADIGITF